ncbi:MAG: HAMP domain-containing histidine kinase [Burkholderiaceae bacterium]|nr:HAMP domain-containing histidine kinase [Burkholderiaceae bacterium]
MTQASPSITRRLARTLLAGALLWSVAVSLAVWLAVRHEVRELLDDTLQGAAEAMQATLDDTPDTPQPLIAEPARASDRYAWQLVDYAGGGAPRLLQASTRAPRQPFSATPLAGFADRPGWRVYGVAVEGSAKVLYVAQSQNEQMEAVWEVVFDAALATLSVALLMYLWLRLRVARELLPLQHLSERVRGHDLLAPGATLGPAAREELQPLHQALDELASQLARRLAQERAFSAHAAHALRTPLAGMDAQLAVALREAPEALQPRLQRVRAAADRLQRVVVVLLALFRSGVELRRETVALDALLSRLPVEGLDVQVPADACVDADPDLLAAALLNLLDNAVRHGAQRVQISLPAPQQIFLQDDGPGVSEAHRLALQAALVHDDPEGPTGLGLVLAHWVAQAHGGRLQLPHADSGFAVVLELGGTGDARLGSPASPA